MGAQSRASEALEPAGDIPRPRKHGLGNRKDQTRPIRKDGAGNSGKKLAQKRGVRKRLTHAVRRKINAGTNV